MNAAARIADNVAAVRQRIAEAASRAGRSADSVTLVAVTKYVSAEIAQLLVEAGCRDLGESRPQELWSKAEILRPGNFGDVRWHLIGHLQRNKVRRTLSMVRLIHTVDSERLLTAIDEEARAIGTRRAEVLIEVNISGDASKTGLAASEVEPLLAAAGTMSGVSVRGLMGMASLTGGPATAQHNFAALRSLRDRLQRNLPENVSLDELSMGMSDDFEVAIAEGATIVRIGSALVEGVVA
jgi:pyridoxal phosphate enzyme (YggS family)